MTTLCPLSLCAKDRPCAPLIIGETPFTYLEMERYVQQLQSRYSHIQEGQVLATSSLSPSFFCALLIASYRSKWILFPINSQLPPKEINERLKETKAVCYFQESVAYDNEFAFSQDLQSSYSPDKPLTYLLTSGSTSRPKICVHSSHNHFSSAHASNETLPYTSNDRWHFSLPLYHVSGLSLIFRTLLAQASLVASQLPLENALIKYRSSHLSCVPTLLAKLLETPKNLKLLRVILLGGAPSSAKLLKKAQENHLPVYLTYGLTEFSSQIASKHVTSDGLTPLPHCKIRLDSKHQICVKGPSLFMGYLENGQIIQTVDLDGYFLTRDTGEFKNQHLKIKGRLDTLFISGGENIFPEEIEGHLMEHPDILEAVVVPQNCERFGQVPLAYLKSTRAIDPEKFIQFLEPRLPRYKIPKKYLPLTITSLKPSRKALAEAL